MYDLRFALRQLLKNPGFTTVAVLTLALGIGTCTAMFSILNAVLLKPLPFPQPAKLVWIENIFPDGLSGRTTRVDTFLGWREQSQSFESLAAYFAFSDYWGLILSGEGAPERLRGVGVSDNFLPTLGVQPLYGRNFTAEECQWRGTDGLNLKPGAVILSYDYWQRRFGGDPGIVGRTLTLNAVVTTVAGVLPPTFHFSALFTPGSDVDVITPFPLTPQTAQWGNTVFGVGRLKPDRTPEQAEAELRVINEQLRKKITGGEFGARVSSLDTALRGRFQTAFLILAAAVFCVLIIACVNLSNLLLARLNSRRQEFAVRMFLGAARRHLIQQTLAESLLLASAGSLLGVPLAAWATRLLAHLQTFGVPLLESASVDSVALLVTIGLTTLAGLACGLLPALQLSRTQSSSATMEATHQRSTGRSGAAVRSVLVVTEVALACVLLVGAGLLIRSFNSILQVNLGFQPRHALAWRIDPSRQLKNGEQVDGYLRGMAESISALPGVEAVGFTDTLPLGRNRSWGVGAVGVQYPPGQFPDAYPRLVDANYLQAMQIPLKMGRYFDERFNPTAEKAVIINENFARQLWPGQDPLGRKITIGRGATVIGVVANVRHSSLEEEKGNEVYIDCRQNSDWSTLEMVVRSNRPTESLVPEVRKALALYDPSLPTAGFHSLDQLVDAAVGPRQLITRLLGFFSALALALAAVGLYGVITFSVSQRSQEIGIRMAVGAQKSDVLSLVMKSGLKLAMLGVAFGLAGSLALTRLLKSLLFGITAHDPGVFAWNALLLLIVASLACLIPAMRAMRADPMVVLRAE